jgi:hypothetical protein
MKRIVVGLFIALVAAGGLFAQEVTLSGELKTGFYIQQEKIGNNDPVASGGMTNNDGDSGAGQARMRLDFHSLYGNMGLKVRFQIEPGTTAEGPFSPTWAFAYAYGNLFDNQLTISAGLLGESPWGTGGPRLNSEPESREYRSVNGLSGEPYISSEGLIGIRFEYKPSFIEGLNIGFVLNQPDQVVIDTQKQEIFDMLMESVVGAAYENDYFAVRVGYRFDSDADMYNGSYLNEGSRLTYRLEEKVLDNVAEGMKIWLNGEYYGIGCEQQTIEFRNEETGDIISKKTGVGEYIINWLYWLWDTDNFIAKLDVGLGIYKAYNNEFFKPISERQEYMSMEFLPGFYFKFFDNLLQAGLGLGFGMEFGPGKTYKNSSYQYYSIEPQLRLNMGNNAYVATVYNYTNKYAWWREGAEVPEGVKEGDKSGKHSLNIRAVYSF